MPIVGMGEIGRISRRIKQRQKGMGENHDLEGMGRKFRVKVKPKAIVKKAVKAHVTAVKKSVKVATKAATSKIGQTALRAGAAYATVGTSEAYLRAAKTAKGLLSKGKGLVDVNAGFEESGGSSQVSQTDSVSTSQSSPFVVAGGMVDRAVEALPDAMTEEVEEVNEATGKKEKVKKVKPVIKYGGMAAVAGLIALLILKKKKK